MKGVNPDKITAAQNQKCPIESFFSLLYKKMNDEIGRDVLSECIW